MGEINKVTSSQGGLRHGDRGESFVKPKPPCPPCLRGEYFRTERSRAQGYRNKSFSAGRTICRALPLPRRYWYPRIIQAGTRASLPQTRPATHANSSATASSVACIL